MAILCADKVRETKDGDYEALALYSLSEDEYRKLFQDAGLFTNVVTKPVTHAYHFNTYEIFKRWFKASTHRDLDDMDPDFVKQIMDEVATFHDDGSITLDTKEISIIACKN